MSASGDKKTKSMPTAMACYEQRSCMLDLKALLSRNKLTDRNEVVSNYLDRSPLPRSSDSTTTTQSKSTSDSAMLAQRLASESSWADTYVPASPSGTGMTPSAPSIAEMSEAQLDEEPPTYESVASEAGRNQPSSSSQQQVIPLQQDAIAPVPSAQAQPRAFVPDGHYSRHETHNSINGTFTLRDSLDLSTTSGSISIKLDVKPGAHPAILKLKSKSGSIRVDDKQCDIAQNRSLGSTKKGSSSSSRSLWWIFGKRSESEQEIESPPVPMSDDPRKQAGQQQQQQQEDDVEEQKFVARLIHTTIESSSGSVNGQLLLTAGSEIHIRTSSGSLNMRLVTTGAGSNTRMLSKLEQEYAHAAGTASSESDLRSALTTTSGSGSQNITISSGATDTSGGAIISALQAKHHSTGSGSMNINYPRDWFGMVHASIGGSGNVSVRGDGLEYDKRGKSEVYAWRGVDLGSAYVNVELRTDGSGGESFSC